MATKAQHGPHYADVPGFLKSVREEAGFTQRDLGERLDRPQSWVHNCETGNRRVDVAEFVLWCRACSANPSDAIAKLRVRGK